jgi:hypothetical protein
VFFTAKLLVQAWGAYQRYQLSSTPPALLLESAHSDTLTSVLKKFQRNPSSQQENNNVEILFKLSEEEIKELKEASGLNDHEWLRHVRNWCIEDTQKKETKLRYNSLEDFLREKISKADQPPIESTETTETSEGFVSAVIVEPDNIQSQPIADQQTVLANAAGNIEPIKNERTIETRDKPPIVPLIAATRDPSLTPMSPLSPLPLSLLSTSALVLGALETDKITPRSFDRVASQTDLSDRQKKMFSPSLSRTTSREHSSRSSQQTSPATMPITPEQEGVFDSLLVNQDPFAAHQVTQPLPMPRPTL